MPLYKGVLSLERFLEKIPDHFSRTQFEKKNRGQFYFISEREYYTVTYPVIFNASSLEEAKLYLENKHTNFIILEVKEY